MSGFRVNPEDLLRLGGLLADIKDGVSRVTATSVNKTLAGVQTDAVQEVYDDLNLTKTRIRQDFRQRKASYSTPSGALEARGKPVGLMSFGAVERKPRGTSVKVKRAQRRSVIRHAFIAHTRKGKAAAVGPQEMVGNVFRRQLVRGGAAGKRVGRLPLERLEGPRIEDILAKPVVMDRVMAKAAERFAKNIDYETQRILDKHR